MKTKTHYLYGFIIVSLVVALVITSLSKPPPESVETTPPVERTTEMVTLPTSDTDEDTDDNTDENDEKVYHDTFYTLALYLFYFSFLMLVLVVLLYRYYSRCNLPHAKKTVKILVFLSFFLYLLSAVLSSFVSLDTVYTSQKIFMIFLTLFFPIIFILYRFVLYCLFYFS